MPTSLGGQADEQGRIRQAEKNRGHPKHELEKSWGMCDVPPGGVHGPVVFGGAHPCAEGKIGK